MNESEINFIRNKMKDNVSIRTTLLTFSFTSVITIIGFGISNYKTIPCVIYLLPIIIVMVFSCRIAYYIDQQSRWGAYLAVYHENSIKYKDVYKNVVPEFADKNKIISFITKNELLMMSVVSAIMYYIKFFGEYNIKKEKYLCVVLFMIPILFLGIQFKIISTASSYTERRKYYIKLLQSQSP